MSRSKPTRRKCWFGLIGCLLGIVFDNIMSRPIYCLLLFYQDHLTLSIYGYGAVLKAPYVCSYIKPCNDSFPPFPYGLAAVWNL